MKVLGVAGDPEETATLVDDAVGVLADRGTVAVVDAASRLPCGESRSVGAADHREAGPSDHPDTGASDHRDAGARTTHRLGVDGWIGTGPPRDLDDVLDDLAVEHDYALVRGFEDAALPTVAVGDVEPAGPVVLSVPDPANASTAAVADAIEDREPRETLSSLVARAKQVEAAGRAGAVATFTGRVRRRDHPEDVATEHLEFESYEDVTAERTAAIRSDLLDREGVFEVLLHHRTGVVAAGEDVVHVVVLAGHRAEAFAAVEDGIDRLKAEVPLFKKEVTVEGEFWRHQHGGDHHPE